jgi:hypothetical protein
VLLIDQSQNQTSPLHTHPHPWTVSSMAGMRGLLLLVTSSCQTPCSVAIFAFTPYTATGNTTMEHPVQGGTRARIHTGEF